MKKDLLIGAIDNYTWNKINPWAISIRECGFTDDVVLLGYRIDSATIENAKQLGIDVYQIDYDAFGNPINHNANGRDTQCHQLRFFHAWQLLKDIWSEYDNVIMTDVRDVIFQRNPSSFLYNQDVRGILCSSEGITYGNEPWNMDNMIRGFGPHLADIAQPWVVYNVGVLAGKSHYMKELSWTLYNNTTGRYIPCDQSAFNILLREGLLANHFTGVGHDIEWACQCGTMLDPEKSHYKPLLTEPVPIVHDGWAYTQDNKLYTIVHQWDRVPSLKSAVESRYA